MANYAVSAMSVVTGSGKLAPVTAIPVVIITDGSVKVGPGAAQRVVEVAANYPRAPTTPVPIVYATGTPPVAPTDPIPVFVTAGAVAAVGFDPATVTNVTLSNGNLTATHTSAVSNSGARVAAPQTSGKYYFEIKSVVFNAGDVFGLCTAANTYTQVLSTNATVIMYAVANGNLNVFSSFAGNIGGAAANDVIGFAIDLTAGHVWIRKNAGNWNGSGTANPATDTGGFAFTAGTALEPVVAFATGVGNEQCIANFGGATFANPAPSGFGNWPAAGLIREVVPAPKKTNKNNKTRKPK